MCMHYFFVLMQDQPDLLLPLCQDQSPLRHKAQEKSQVQPSVLLKAYKHHAHLQILYILCNN